MTSSKTKPPLISILVPIYNVEKYLDQCLQSLVNQTLENIEIICINDGSTDKSLDIIKKYHKKDPRIVIIDKPNSGYGDSMNQGLKKATGEFIGIVESDDFIDTNAFKYLTNLAKKYRAEVVRANYYEYKEGFNTKMRFVPIYETNRIIDPNQHTWLFTLPASIWAAIYRREFLEKHQISFLPTPGASYQDTSFAFKVYASAKRVCLTTNAYLHYRLDNESSSVNNTAKVFCVCNEYAEIESYLKKHHRYEDLATIMWICKFSIYYWNAIRLNSKYLFDFLNRASGELIKAVDSSIPVDKYYDYPGRRELVNALLSRNIHHACRIIKQHKRINHHYERREKSPFHPYRKKALTIQKTILSLEADLESLEQQMRDIYSNQEQTHA